jgi:hypothetical protein
MGWSPAEELVERKDGHVLAAEFEQSETAVRGAIDAHVLSAFDMPDVAAAERVSFRPDIAAENALVGGRARACHDFFRSASIWPIRAGDAT